MSNPSDLLVALAAIDPVPFNPRTLEWVTFVVVNLIISVIYILRYLASNRKTHQYIHMTNDGSQDSVSKPGGLSEPPKS